MKIIYCKADEFMAILDTRIDTAFEEGKAIEAIELNQWEANLVRQWQKDNLKDTNCKSYLNKGGHGIYKEVDIWDLGEYDDYSSN